VNGLNFDLLSLSMEQGAGQIFNLPRTDDFSRHGKVPSHLTAKVVSTVAFQNKIKNLSCTHGTYSIGGAPKNYYTIEQSCNHTIFSLL